MREALVNSTFATLVMFADYLDSIRLDRAGVPSPILAPIGQEVTIVNFSRGVDNGRGQLVVVPEPMAGAWWLVLCFARLRRTRTS